MIGVERVPSSGFDQTTFSPLGSHLWIRPVSRDTVLLRSAPHRPIERIDTGCGRRCGRFHGDFHRFGWRGLRLGGNRRRRRGRLRRQPVLNPRQRPPSNPCRQGAIQQQLHNLGGRSEQAKQDDNARAVGKAIQTHGKWSLKDPGCPGKAGTEFSLRRDPSQGKLLMLEAPIVGGTSLLRAELSQPCVGRLSGRASGPAASPPEASQTTRRWCRTWGGTLLIRTSAPTRDAERPAESAGNCPA